MRKLFAGCIAVSFAAMLAACGDDSSSTSPETSGNESSSSAAILSGDSHDESSPSSSSELPPDTTCCKVKESSSSVASSESRSLVSGGVWPKFLWDGSTDEEGRVVTGSDGEMAGYWYDFNDIDDGGSSKFTFPPDIEEYCNGNWYESVNCFEFMMETYGGIKEKVVLGAGAEVPHVGLGFNTLNEDQDGADVTEWGGLCLEYSSGLKFQVKIVPEYDLTMLECDFIASIGASESKKVVDIPWSKFGSSCGLGMDVDASKVLANAAAVHLLFEGKAGDTGDFLLKKIGSLGQCGSGSAPVSSSAVAPKSSSSSVAESSSSAKLIIGNMLWDGFSNRTDKVSTGGDKTSGYWYEFNDNSEGGSSTIEFPPDVDTLIYGSPFPELIEKYRGVQLGVAFGSGYEKPYAGVAFNVWSEEQEGVNVYPWGGLCLQYKSSIDFEIELGLEEGAFPTMGSCSFVASVPASTSEKISDFGWEKFKNNCGAGVSPDLTDALKKVASVRLKFSGAAGTTGDFLIQRIGAVGMCRDMIPAP
ncbi:hypothetical protein SAMN05720781_2935 [Fibrobacter sp. UWT3]|uniref:hypothetical protein n=1 Tax=Fibrobacter sp. UWT3 TaxID=1896225 RepID=UPI000BCF12D8|nr:hypothetical protein [Fibrobacter sp. UWT3]SOE79219.1 hypothetical protein SAMN05720781_2935 [Fibrobacter sp. UWT3]